MPFIHVETATGPVDFNYTISTPKLASAEAIDPSIPTVLFMHSVYIAQMIYCLQFADPLMRRFNLVAIDTRGHGDTVGNAGTSYNQVDAAKDVSDFMEAMKLPPCHLFGMSMGACVALQLAISFPEKALSVFMVSPVPLEEPAEILDGRREIYDCWVAAFDDPENIDNTALYDAVCGSVVLGFNGDNNALVQALNNYTVPQALRNWSPEHFDAFHAVTVKFFSDRKPHSREELEKVKTPIQIIHCSGDIAYPVIFMQELLGKLQNAGLKANLVEIENAPHFGAVTNPKEINTIFHDFVMGQTKIDVPSPPLIVKSPFEESLRKAGWSQDESSDEDVFV